MKKWWLLSIVILASCVKDRIDLPQYTPTYTSPLRINEFLASSTGTPWLNEFGVASDWFEIYNSSDSTVHFTPGKYFCTDDQTRKGKYALPDFSIPAKSFFTIWCDSDDTLVDDIHTNFNLKSSGEFIGLYEVKGSDTIVVDEKTFGAQVVGVSQGRFPDGENSWFTMSNPTPGLPNQK